MEVTQIKTQKKRKNRFSIFVDGRYRFSMDYNTLISSGLHVGDTVDDHQIEQLELKDQFARARDYSFMLLSYRDRSEYELKNRLSSKGFAHTVAEEVVEFLKKQKLIDDRVFVDRWLEGVVHSRPMGRIRAVHELRKKRINRELIEKACSAKLDRNTENILARKAAQKKMGSMNDCLPEVKKRRLFRYLQNRGFAFDIINEVMEEYFSDNFS
ncbi:MAG: regulatory protein RecX [Spirochaetota bacterium]